MNQHTQGYCRYIHVYTYVHMCLLELENFIIKDFYYYYYYTHSATTTTTMVKTEPINDDDDDGQRFV